MITLRSLIPFAKRERTPEEVLEVLSLGGDAGSAAGVLVNAKTAMRVAAVLACMRVIAEGVAQLPLHVRRRTGDNTSEVAADLTVNRVLSRKPNEWQTPFEFVEMMTSHAVISGDGYAFINRAGRENEVQELIPFQPSQVEAVQGADYAPLYRVRSLEDGELIGTFGAENILHMRGPSWDGFHGTDTVRQARDVIGLAAALEDGQAREARNGGAPSGILSTEQPVTPEVVKSIREAYQKSQTGANRGKVAVLDGGWDFKAMGANARDQQLIETRRFQIEEICRVMRVSPLMVQQSDKASTYGSAEQFFNAHVIHTLGPWVRRWEQRLDASLLGHDRELFTKFNVTGLLRGDSKARSAFYHAAVLDGWMTRNEVRALEDMQPLDGLDEPLVPLNMGDGGEDDDDAETGGSENGE